MSNPFDLTGALNTVFRQPPTPPPYDRFNWHGLQGKPYVTVSAKGIKNGLSDRMNDGADFGIDTPNTKTSGIQEAINYQFNHPEVSIKMFNQTYTISADAPWIDIGTATWYLGTSKRTYHIYSLVELKANQTGIMQYSIHGSGGTLALGSATPYANPKDNVGFTVIDMSNVSEYPSVKGDELFSVGFMFAVGSAPSDGRTTALNITDMVFLQDNVHVVRPGAINFSGTASFLENLSILPSDPQVAAPTPNNEYQWAFAYDGGDGDMAWANNLFAINQSIAFKLGAHANAGVLATQGCYRNIFTDQNHSPHVFRADIQNPHISFTVNYTGERGMIIDHYDGEGGQPYYDVEIPMNGEGGTYGQFVRVGIMTYEGGRTTGVPQLGNASSTNKIHFERIKNYGDAIGFGMTTPSVPASGTDLVNDNAFRVKIYIIDAGTVSAYTLTLDNTSETIRDTLRAGQVIELRYKDTINITYSAAPTWQWYADTV